MTQQEKDKLIQKLSAKKGSLFNLRYSIENRQWFSKKIINYLLSKTPVTPDADVEQKTKDIITQATAAVKARQKKGFSSGSLKSNWAIYDEMTSRLQIIYGAVAMHPQFLEAPNPIGFFDFIIERRFRLIKRMVYFVNPNNVRNIFDYASDTCKVAKVNKDASGFWTGFLNGTLPFILSTTGKADPVTADEKIFIKNKACDKNIFGCDPVSTILHIDSLQEAKDKSKLLKQLVTEGDQYLKIDHPLGHFGNYNEGAIVFGITTVLSGTGNNVELTLGNVGQFLLLYSGTGLDETTVSNDMYFALTESFIINMGNDNEVVLVTGVNPGKKKIRIQKLLKAYPAGAKLYWHKHNYPAYHFLTDTRPDNALFDQASIKVDDLQVGDHFYVRNHPLYAMYYPIGVWGGEHSFAVEIGDRDIVGSTFESTLKVAGHGLSMTLIEMATDMLNWINRIQSFLQDLTRQHIANLKANGYNTTTNVKVITKQDGAFTYKIFEYNTDYNYFDYRTGLSVSSSNGFVIKEEISEPQKFQIYNIDTKDSTKPPTSSTVVAFIGNSFNNTSRYILSNWGLKMFNTENAKFESTPLFESDNKTEKILGMEDLKKSAPFGRFDESQDLYVTRPRVDFSATYQAFLKTNGAY